MNDSLDRTEPTPPTYEQDGLGEQPPAPLAADRAAHGTRSKITLPPPIPARARRWTTSPPPIPTAARRSPTLPPPLPPGALRASAVIPAFVPEPARVVSGPIPTPTPTPTPTPLPAPIPMDTSPDFDPPEPAAPEVPNLPKLPAPSEAWLRTSRAPTRPPELAAPAPALAPPLEIDIAIETPAAAYADDDPADNATEYFDRSDEPAPARNLAPIIGVGAGVGVIGLLLVIGLHGRGSSDDAPAPAPPASTARIAAATMPIAAPRVPAPVTAPVAAITTTAPTAAPAPVPPPQEVAPQAPAPAAIATAAPVAAPAPAIATAAPVVAPAPPAPIALAAMPITSQPAGAIVTLIDNGTAIIVGRTPVTASINPARAYDVVFALGGHPTRIEHVGAGAVHPLSIDLAEPRAAAIATAAPEPTPSTVPVRRRSTRTIAPKAVTPKPAAIRSATPAAVTATRPVKQVATATAPSPTSADSGVLMLSAKPPCDIAIDGKPTRMVTPQRAIQLAPGMHSITLTNAHASIRKTLTVRITAKQTTKLIQDFTPPR